MQAYQAVAGGAESTEAKIHSKIKECLDKKEPVDILAYKPHRVIIDDLEIDLVRGLEYPLIRRYDPPWNVKKGKWRKNIRDAIDAQSRKMKPLQIIEGSQRSKVRSCKRYIYPGCGIDWQLPAGTYTTARPRPRRRARIDVPSGLKVRERHYEMS